MIYCFVNEFEAVTFISFERSKQKYFIDLFFHQYVDVQLNVQCICIIPVLEISCPFFMKVGESGQETKFKSDSDYSSELLYQHSE